MSADENESVDIQLSNWRSNNSSRIDLEEELNRMERPSRVFNSHHHLSMPPVLTDTINMEQNEQVRSSRDNTYDESSSSTTQNAGSIEVASVPMNDESEEDDRRGCNVNLTLWRKDIVVKHVGHDHRPAHTRSVRLSKKFVDQPYVIVKRSSPSQDSSHRVTRTNRSVNVSSTNRGYNDHPPGRSQTPEQELPKLQVIENVMEHDNSDNQYDEVYPAHVQEGILSVSSHNDADSGDDRGSSHFLVSENHNINADEENRNGTLDIPNETPRTRVVPSIMSPTPFSPPPESPSDTPEILATGVNNDLPDVPAVIPLITNNDDNQ
uniref:Uncharacterized protein n=1 Tax=Schizaphis graminum TaxID=13262 RepID=A0A2S2NK19_SCHGA